ncbi:hypothetical protein V494_03495 [Pseudogymnoascus sp. VKM F-4513 (FW-928)]|nr:hypothetical protein V494_03495 [Pseudogymnoascus sp. VKM F-4513 (FW-928)]
MLALWSRTVQASRSCQCGTCLQASARVARTSRSTAAAGRRLRPSDVFTASFSAMLATAAIYDTRRKDKRLSQWDRAIEEVRSGKDLATISTPDQVSIGKAADESSNIMGNEVVEYTPDANICRKLEQGATTVRHLMSYMPVPIHEASQATATPRLRESMTPVWDELKDILWENAQESGNQRYIDLDSRVRNDPIEYSAVAMESDRRLLEGSEFAASTMSHWVPRTTYQLDQMERNVNTLVHQLWRATSMSRRTERHRAGISTDVDNDMDSDPEIKRLSKLLAPMLDGYTPAPDYPKARRVGDESSVADLNATLESITKTQGFQERNYDLMLAKICYNLFTSTAVPDTTTYEILIRAFTKLEKPELAEVVVHRFRNNMLRPHEGILSAILVHYGYTRDQEMFYKTIRQMAGMEEGLGFESHHVYSLTSPTIQKWALESDVIHRDGVLYEKAHRNSEIFESLIRGCMNFHNLDGALRYFKTAIKEGCYVRSRIFADIVYYSLTSPERTSALLRIVTALSWQFGKRERPGGGLEYNSDVRGQIHDVLEACGLGSALSGSTNAAEVLLDIEHPLARFIYPEQFASMIRHFHEEEAKDMASYRAQRAQFFERTVLEESEGVPEGVGSVLMEDTPSFVKMSKLFEDGSKEADGEEVMTAPTPSPRVVEEPKANFRPLPSRSFRDGPVMNEYKEEGQLAGCF